MPSEMDAVSAYGKWGDGPDPLAVQRRLRILQEYLECESQAEFAAKLDLTPSHLNHFMRPNEPRELPKRVLITIRERYSIGVDWMWFGERAGLPLAVVEKLDRAEDKLIAEGEISPL